MVCRRQNIHNFGFEQNVQQNVDNVEKELTFGRSNWTRCYIEGVLVHVVLSNIFCNSNSALFSNKEQSRTNQRIKSKSCEQSIFPPHSFMIWYSSNSTNNNMLVDYSFILNISSFSTKNSTRGNRQSEISNLQLYRRRRVYNQFQIMRNEELHV